MLLPRRCGARYFSRICFVIFLESFFVFHYQTRIHVSSNVSVGRPAKASVVLFRGQGICNRQRHSSSASLSCFKCQQSYTFSRYLCRYASPRRRFTTCVLLWVPNAALRNVYVHTYHWAALQGAHTHIFLSLSSPLFFFLSFARYDITFYVPLHVRSSRRTFSLFSSFSSSRSSLRTNFSKRFSIYRDIRNLYLAIIVATDIAIWS